MLLLLLLLRLQPADCNFTTYTWQDKGNYFFDNLGTKVQQMIAPACIAHVVYKPDNSMGIPLSEYNIYIRSMPYSSELFAYWKNIPPPQQHRVEKLLCEAPMTRKRSIFQIKGCLLDTYMMPSAPRCQNSYLAHLCYSAVKDTTDMSASRFYTPEGDHSTTRAPPTPWLLTATNATVTLCGHVITPCGVIRTTANCMASSFDSFLNKFQTYCALPTPSFKNLQEGDEVACPQAKLAPLSGKVVYIPRVFVVAEVDDTYVYHIHLEVSTDYYYCNHFVITSYYYTTTVDYTEDTVPFGLSDS
jgi:hypothetical protein